MIITHQKYLGRYKGLHPHVDEVITYIEKTDLKTLPLGKTELSDHAFVNVFEYLANHEINEFFEGHKNWLDIHMVLEGAEKMACIEEHLATPTQAYDPATDCAFYKGEATTECLLKDGQCLIVFPEDLHEPKIRVNDEKVKKVVFKVKL